MTVSAASRVDSLAVSAFAGRVESLFVDEVREFLENVPYASHLTDPEVRLSERYYVRHRIETVHRIRLTARTDALGLAKMMEEDYDLARDWADYVVEEMGHDRLFLDDLATHGVPEAEALATPPFPATVRLIEHLEETIASVGSIAPVAYALFVEWNSERYSPAVVEKATRTFGGTHTIGSRSHIGIDEAEDHFGVIMLLAYRLSEITCGEEGFRRLVRLFAADLRDYFTELHGATAALETQPPFAS